MTGCLSRAFYDTAGSTLIENVVALALLLTVLLPAGAFLGEYTLQRPAAVRSEALGLARAELERALYSEPGGPGATTIIGKFRIVTAVERTLPGNVIDVRVSRKGSDRILVHLSTLRRPE